MSTTPQAKIRKMLLASGLGFISGVGGMMAFFSLGFEPVWEGGRVAAGGVGVVYLMTGLFTLAGALMPGVGAKVLNVSDEEELREMRSILVGSAISVIAMGIMLLVLAGSGPGGAVPDAVTVGAVGIALITMIVVSVRQWAQYDELWRRLSWESSAFALSVLLPTVLVWAVAVHLGYLSAMEPLLVISLLAGSILVGAFIAAGRRGLLVPR